MNEIISSLKNRKSVRVFEQKPIGSKEKAAILDAAIQAPTAGNMTLYTIIDVTNQKLKDTLAVTCDNQPFIAKAPLVLVFCADYYRWMQAFKKHVDDVRNPSYGDLFLCNADALIAAQNAVVAAESLGIGSCYIGDITENFEKHRELFDLPDYVVPACMLCFGYPAKSQIERQKPQRFKAEDIVFENTYNKEKADSMEDMLSKRQNIDKDKIGDYISKFCTRKHNSDFSIEMSRSCKAMTDFFTGGNA
ncbi:MAG: nitroreductase family protein [Clostridia bacterium]|nr:nitroreductase family protein [Clostridia bacterium]